MERPFWHIPKMWKDQTAFIIGGGPSLKGMDWTPFRRENVIGCNDAYMLGDWVDYCYFGDNRWYHIHSQFPAYLKFKNPRVTCRHDLLNKPHIDRVVETWPDGFWPYDDRVGWYGNTGASAIDLAWKLGSRKVILLGYDMRTGEDRGEFNWHDNLVHPFMNSRNDHSESTLGKFVAQFEKLEKDRRKRAPDLEVLNANPKSALKVFRRITLKEAIDACGRT